MRAHQCQRDPAALAQHGATMLEILVVLFIITLFLLVTAGIQSSSVKLTKAAEYRTEAVLLATEIGERMEANLAAATTGLYACPDGCPTTTTTTPCVNRLCLPAELATTDLAEWGQRVAATLPAPTVTITYTAANATVVPATPHSYTITIVWEDRRANIVYSDTSGATERSRYIVTKTVFSDPTS